MPSQAPSRKILVYLGFPLFSVLITLILLEAILQLVSYQPAVIAAPEHRACGECSYLFEPIPVSGKTNSFGLNSPEISVAKPKDTFRAVMIGDSITYGKGIGLEDSPPFSRILEENLRSQHPHTSIEVINAGVRGYSTYNEVRFLRDRLMQFSPDLIVLQTCMNDIANPRWHWNSTSRVEIIPPADAFPRPEEKDIPPPTRKFSGNLLKHSVLYSIGWLTYLKFKGIDVEKRVGVEVNGKFWPTYITAEADSTLEPLTRYDSVEWQWMRKQFDIAVEISRREKIPLVLLIVPMAYELTPGYPLDPESNYLRYCKENDLVCVNLREVFTGHTPQELYIYKGYSKLPRLPDMWHFNAKGHELTAQTLAEVVRENHYLD